MLRVGWFLVTVMARNLQEHMQVVVEPDASLAIMGEPFALMEHRLASERSAIIEHANARFPLVTDPLQAKAAVVDAVAKAQQSANAELKVAQVAVQNAVLNAQDAVATGEKHVAEQAQAVRQGFFHVWAELVASNGLVAHGFMIPEESRSVFYLTLSVSILSVIMLAGMCYWVSKRTGSALQRGERTLGQLCGLTAFRFYSGMLMCTWLPFLLAEEGETLWPSHQSLFMGTGKMILAFAMVLCPIFGLLNDQTLHQWGRRRAWFMGGVCLIVSGVVLCAFASAAKWPSLYLVGTMMWCIGESAAESTTEALVPDLCEADDYNRAASVRGVMFMAGGFVGYALIIVSSMYDWNQSAFYVYYLIAVLFGAPWSIHYACPSDGEKRALERLNDPSIASAPLIAEDVQVEPQPEESYWKQCYVNSYNASPEFRYVSIATFVFSMSTAGMMLVILILRDLVGMDDDRQIEFHMACLSMMLMVPAMLASVVIGCIGIDAQSRYWYFGLFIAVYTVTEMAIPCIYFSAQTVNSRLLVMYIVVFFKGFSFGGIYNIMQPITWDAIPDDWKAGTGSVSRATAWISVCRSFGVGVGNFVIGFILDVFRTYSVQDDVGANRYPVSGYMALFAFTSICGLATIWILDQRNAAAKSDAFFNEEEEKPAWRAPAPAVGERQRL